MTLFIFKYSDYKAFVRDWVKSRPRGEYRKISAAVGVSSTLISQVFNGEKDLNAEQACELGEYLGLNPSESRYLSLLVDFARAGSVKLRKRLREQIVEQQREHSEIKRVVETDTRLTPAATATYYSSWLFTGVRNLSALEGMGSVPAIADRLNIPRAQVEKVMSFLLAEGLCQLDARGQIVPGHRRTHTGSDSSLVQKHHQNWRMRAFDKMTFPEESQLFYTAPMSLSVEDAAKLRTELLAFIKHVNAVVGPSRSETVRCLNVDWFEF